MKNLVCAARDEIHTTLKVLISGVSVKKLIRIQLIAAIFKTRNGESGNGNGERGIVKSGNL